MHKRLAPEFYDRAMVKAKAHTEVSIEDIWLISAALLDADERYVTTLKKLKETEKRLQEYIDAEYESERHATSW